MSKNIQTFNLREGAFPIKMKLVFEDINLQNIGRLKDSVYGDIQISLISKDLFHCECSISTVFIDKCQACLKDIEVNLNFSSNISIKDQAIMMDDDSNQNLSHYQDLESYSLINSNLVRKVNILSPNLLIPSDFKRPEYCLM